MNIMNLLHTKHIKKTSRILIATTAGMCLTLIGTFFPLVSFAQENNQGTIDWSKPVQFLPATPPNSDSVQLTSPSQPTSAAATPAAATPNADTSINTSANTSPSVNSSLVTNPVTPTGTTNTNPTAPTGTTNSTCPANQLCNPLKVSSIQAVLYLIVSIATYIGVILAVLALIWVGFKFIAAQGNPEKLSEARKFFYAVVIGIAILIGANAIITIMENTLTSAGVVQSGVFGNS
jgi:hypothetical protein